MTSFLAFRKIDDFLRNTKATSDDLIASDFGIAVLGDVGPKFLVAAERDKINKKPLTSRTA